MSKSEDKNKKATAFNCNIHLPADKEKENELSDFFKEKSIDEIIDDIIENIDDFDNHEEIVLSESDFSPSAVAETDEAEYNNEEPLSFPNAVSVPVSEPPDDKTVVGQTAGFWKYKSVSENMVEPSPEYKNDTVQFPKSRIIAARVRGKKHKHEGTNCDDWYEFANFGDITIVAVSDGAGVKKFSRIGAKVSCKAAVGFLLDAISHELTNHPEFRDNLSKPIRENECADVCSKFIDIIRQAFHRAYASVESAFYERFADVAYYGDLKRKLKLDDFSATLILAVIIPSNEKTGDNLVISCHVGDGAIAIVDRSDKSIKIMNSIDSEGCSDETVFLTSLKINKDTELQLRTRLFQGKSDVVFIMTNGVADDYFPYESEMQRLYFDLIANGVLDGENAISPTGAFTPKQQKLLEALPPPLSYPWVNDREVKIALHYTKHICETVGLSMSDLWQDDTVLLLAGAESDAANRGQTRGERMQIWLDNYVERGSSDDRTLVIVEMQGDDSGK